MKWNLHKFLCNPIFKSNTKILGRNANIKKKGDEQSDD